MKKTLSIVLALVFVVAAFASFALTADSSSSDAFKLVSVKVTDANGYANIYAAVDNSAAYAENQAAYVVVEWNVKGTDTDTYTAPVGPYETTITSSSLDLSYADATDKASYIKESTIYAASSVDNTAGATLGTANLKSAYDSTNVKVVTTITSPEQSATKTTTNKYFFAFIGVTKAATAGEVKASLKVATTKFATGSSEWAGKDYLVVYDSTGAAKYTIYKLGASKGTYRVYSGKSVKSTDPHIYLFDYVQDGTIFNYIGYSATAASMANDAAAVGFTYDGKLVYLGADGKLGTSDDKDLTSVVADANTFFGFSFATSNPAADSNFEAKTAGNPVVVTDTYAYITAAVTTPDTDVDIAPTGDFSANIVIVLAASAVLAAAALAFVAKKARD